MNINFSDLSLDQEIEIYANISNNDGLYFFDYPPDDLDYDSLDVVFAKIVGLNPFFHNSGSTLCIIIEVPEDYKKCAWNFHDSLEIDDWKKLNWQLSPSVNETTNLFLINFKTVKGIKKENKKNKSSGCACIECKEFYPYAEPNFSNDKLLCYSCRSSYSWKYF